MNTLHKTTIDGIYSIIEPAQRLPLVLDSPHSGTDYPDDFGHACDPATLEKAEDKYVDDLFITAPAHGASFLMARFPRTYIDVNRCERDIDPNLLAEPWPDETAPTARSHAGIGLIRRLVRPGQPVYSRALTVAEIQGRITRYYRPYHAALESLIERAHYDFGAVWHLNCHSMPSQPRHSLRPNPLKTADFVLGDRDGTSCALDFTHMVRDFLKSRGFRVAINDPYKGVELVRRYSAPATGRHSLQIEIARGLYLNEDTYEKTKEYKALKDVIDSLIRHCADYVQAQSWPMAAD